MTVEPPSTRTDSVPAGPQRRQRPREVDVTVALGDDLHPDPSLAEQGSAG